MACLLQLTVQSQTPTTFYVAGHAYGSPGVDNKAFHPSFQDHMNEHHNQFDLGFLTGDFILKPTEQDWNEVDSVLKKWSPKTYFVAGNHDYGNGLIFNERTGGSNMTFRKDRSLFVILNLTNTGWLLTNSQWEMIENALSTDTGSVEQIFILAHQVAFINSDPVFKNVQPNSYDGCTGDLKFFERNLNRITALNLPVYFIAGDVGAIKGRLGSSYHKVKNLHLITSGMGNGESDNFLSIRIEGSTVEISKVDLITEKVTLLDEELIDVPKR